MSALTGEEFLENTGFDMSSVFYNIPLNFFVKKVPIRYYLWVNLKKNNVTFAPSLRKEFCYLTVLGENEKEVDGRVSEIQQEIYKNYMRAMKFLKEINEISSKVLNTYVGIIGSTAQMLCDNTEDLDLLIITDEENFEDAMNLAGEIYKRYLPIQNRTEIEIDIGVITKEKMRKTMEQNNLKGVIYAKYLDEIINPFDRKVEQLNKSFVGTPSYERYKILKTEILLRRKEIKKEIGF
jgi:predicted nucleotidyltransferase